MVATQPANVGPEEWPCGWYGVVKMNNPTFVFPPLPDPKSDDFVLVAQQFTSTPKSVIRWLPPHVNVDTPVRMDRFCTGF